MPPTTEEFKKLMALTRLLRELAAGGTQAGTPAGTPATAVIAEFLDLLPELRSVFGPAFSGTAHTHLDAIETSLRAGNADPRVIDDHAQRVAKSLGISLDTAPQ